MRVARVPDQHRRLVSNADLDGSNDIVLLRMYVIIGLIVTLLLQFPSFGFAQTRSPTQHVLVVYNDQSYDSKKVAEYYAQKRRIPFNSICRIHTDTVSISWDEFGSAVKNPIRRCLARVGPTQILYIVFSFQTPYEVYSVPLGYGISLDQYVADIWDQLDPKSPVPNPYYAEAESRAGKYHRFVSLADYRNFVDAKLIYSVWRLDASSASIAMGLVDKALRGEREGLPRKACIDRRFGTDMSLIQDSGYGAGDWDLHQAAEMLRSAGVGVVEDANDQEFGTPPAPLRCDDAGFYAGWYSLDHYNNAFSWKPGTIGVHLDSASAKDPRGGPNWAANALKKGITITAGALAEPDLEGLPHVDGIVHYLLSGASVGDAFLRSTAWLKWMIINIGDPLYRPRFSEPSRENRLVQTGELPFRGSP
jgi:uncharacterized protein (TIGR03790 family)